VFVEAKTLIQPTKDKDTTSVDNPYSSTPHTPSVQPKAGDDGGSKDLTKLEKTIIDRSFGGDTQQYLEIKEKRPSYVRNLLRIAEENRED
jgi:hypothetical protein